jgi:hypothetical protein
LLPFVSNRRGESTRRDATGETTTTKMKPSLKSVWTEMSAAGNHPGSTSVASALDGLARRDVETLAGASRC